MIDTCSEKKKSSYSTNTKKTIISLQNFQSLPLYSLSLSLSLSKSNLQKEAPENFQAPLTFSLYLALSNLISKINIYSSILSLSLSLTHTQTPFDPQLLLLFPRCRTALLHLRFWPLKITTPTTDADHLQVFSLYR